MRENLRTHLKSYTFECPLNQSCMFTLIALPSTNGNIMYINFATKKPTKLLKFKKNLTSTTFNKIHAKKNVEQKQFFAKTCAIFCCCANNFFVVVQTSFLLLCKQFLLLLCKQIFCCCANKFVVVVQKKICAKTFFVQKPFCTKIVLCKHFFVKTLFCATTFFVPP